MANISAEPLSFDSLKKTPMASCHQYLNSITGVDKNQMKVLSQFTPTYTYEVNGTTKLQQSCTLPSHVMPAYKMSPSQFNCTMHNELMDDNYAVEYGHTTPEDVSDGCVMKFTQIPKYENGAVFDDTAKLNAVLNNTYVALDYDTLSYINALMKQIMDLRSQINKLTTEDLPRAQKEKDDAVKGYNQTKYECDNISTAPIGSLKERRIVNAKNRTLHNYSATINHLKRTLKDYHRQKKINKLIRNIRDLSFVTLFEHTNLKGKKLSYVNELPNLHMNNINQYSEYSNNIRTIPNFPSKWRNQASSIFFPPGMDAELYEGENLDPRSLKVSFEKSSQAWSTRHADFTRMSAKDGRTYNMNDKINSIRIKGAFKPNRKDDTEEFHYKVDHPPPPKHFMIKNPCTNKPAPGFSHTSSTCQHPFMRSLFSFCHPPKTPQYVPTTRNQTPGRPTPYSNGYEDDYSRERSNNKNIYSQRTHTQQGNEIVIPIPN